jgi:hypothetical protein
MPWPNVPSIPAPVTVQDQLMAIRLAAANDGQPKVVAEADRVRGLAPPATPHPEAAVNLAWAASVAVPPQWGKAEAELVGIT